jgi:putative ABC transport system permease protein
VPVSPIPGGIRAGVRRLFRLALRRPDLAHEDVDEELRFHIDERIERFMARGMTREEARAETLRRIGGDFNETRERLHLSAVNRERRLAMREHMEEVLQDVRYAARGLARRPGFTAIAVLTLAIGIGATTAIFSAVHAIILRPLPFADPDRLMRISLTMPADGPNRPARDDMVWSYPKFTMLRDAQTTFQDMAVYSPTLVSITNGEAERVRAEFIGFRYLALLGVAIQRGRNFGPEADSPGAGRREIVLSDALWRRRFGADPAIAGKVLDIDRQPYEIVGVTEPGFSGLFGGVELFVPTSTWDASDLANPESHSFYVVARLKSGVGAAQAAAEVAAVGSRIGTVFPSGFGGLGRGAMARPLDDARVAPLVKRSLYVLFGAVVLVLLIACANLASLLLGRANARRREIAVRLALGAGRARLVRLLLTESVVLSLLGGAASIVVALAGVRVIGRINPTVIARAGGLGGLGAVSFASTHLDAPALLFALCATLATGVLFGLAPALAASRASLTGALKEGGVALRHRSGARLFGGRGALVAAEVALALVLLAGSGLMLRSLSKLLAQDPGFDPRGVLTLRLTMPSGAPPRDSLPGFYVQLIERLNAIPGASGASLGDCAPLGGGCNGTRMTFVDRPEIDFAHAPSVGVHWVTPAWFATLRVPLKAGRMFTDADRAGAPKVVVVNEAAARAFWPGDTPIGKRVGIGQGGFGDGADVIGVVGDVRNRADSLAQPDVYLPYYQSPRGGAIAFVRSSGDPLTLVGPARRAIHELAPQAPVYDVQTMSARAAAATAQARYSAILLALFAGVALALAVIGIYGVMSFTVAQRTREIGIRMALGANRSDVLRMVVGEGIALATVGAVAGLAGALAFTRVLRTLLFDVSLSDPATYVGIVLVLGLAAAVASWIPARRATRVSPTEALRDS